MRLKNWALPQFRSLNDHSRDHRWNGLYRPPCHCRADRIGTIAAPPDAQPGGTLSCGNAEIIRGTLADRDALARLVDGADTVIHCAGAIGAADRSAFASANIDGTRALAAAAAAAGVRRFVHLSSIAAREPALTDYAWSKAGSEMALAAELPAPSFVILRPPAFTARATAPPCR